MSGNTNFPTTLDNDSSLLDVTNNVTALDAPHHNNLKEAVKAIEAKVGVFSTSAPTSLDYRLGNPTGGHTHDGASGMGGPISASSLTNMLSSDHIISIYKQGSLAVGSNIGAPVILGKTMQLISVQAALRRGPSGATTAIDVNYNTPTPSSIWSASQLFRPIFAPGATAFLSSATPNIITYPSGVIITTDVDAVGSNDPGQDLSLNFVFRE